MSKQEQNWGLNQLEIPSIWKNERGEKVVILVIDSGCPTHKDLKSAIIEDMCVNFLEEESDIFDKTGHGTAVCGIIGARDNSFGVVGVAPECKIITAKVAGLFEAPTKERLKMALRYAKILKPHIINISMAGLLDDTKLHDLIIELYEMGIAIVCSAGNYSADIKYYVPAKYPEVISVVAYNMFCKIGGKNNFGENVQFSTPGVGIFTTWINDGYIEFSGTSAAAPFMSGIIALLIGKNLKEGKILSVDQIKELLSTNSIDKGISGRDSKWGYGIVDVKKLLGIDNRKNALQKFKKWWRDLFGFNSPR